VDDFDAKAKGWDADPAKVERARHVASLIVERVPGIEGARVLEVGAGTGLLGLALRGRVRHVTLADGSAEMLAVAREKIEVLGARDVEARVLDLERGPYPDERWDVVCALQVLHHVPDTDAVLRELHRLLSPGGHLCLSDLDAEDGSFHGHGAVAHDGFDRGRLGAALERAGFEDVSFETAFHIERPVAGGVRAFPAFLAVARRT
jgi:ubiquinone/menaquinone biosynthesis C-methylase UbiE